jgi:putative endonuclease
MLTELHKSGEQFPAVTQNWCVYIIRCSDDSLYTGITTDIDRRFSQHAEGSGAKYFRGKQPLQVVYLEKNHTRPSATKREAQIKTMSKAAKTLLAFYPLEGYQNRSQN